MDVGSVGASADATQRRTHTGLAARSAKRIDVHCEPQPQSNPLCLDQFDFSARGFL
jgi:hypothetical protein